MKKLLSIIFLGLFLSETSYAKEIYLDCKTYKLVGYYVDGRISHDEDPNLKLGQLIKINTSNKKIFWFMGLSNNFFEVKEDIRWTDEVITWKENFKKISTDDRFSARTVYYKINRLTLDFETSNVYHKDKIWKKIDEFFRCNLVDKKF